MPIIQVHLMEGRSREQKRRMVAAITDATVEALGVAPDSVRILIHELQPEHYALAGVTAADRPLSARPGRTPTNGQASTGAPE